MTMFPLLQVAVIAAVTAGLRFLPFLLFREKATLHPAILHLSRVLPPAVIGMLMVYALKDTRVLASPHGLPEAIALALVVVTYKYKRNTLLSILGGTVVYMLLVQLVF